MSLKLWHDDNRYPPDDSWEWARTNAEAMAFLESGNVEFISIDMDLGAVEGKDFNYGKPQEGCYRGEQKREVQWLRNMNNDPGENGIDLVNMMIAAELIPARIVVHTWNGWGADAIIKCLVDAGHTHAERIFWASGEAHAKRVYA